MTHSSHSWAPWGQLPTRSIHGRLILRTLNVPTFATLTPWVTFDVERWYLRDWVTSFSVWMPDIVVGVGDRVAVAGNAYHTEVGDFSGQSGEVELCTLVPDGELSPADWDTRLGATIVATGPPPGPPTTLPRVEGTKIFGEQTEPCPPTVLSNDVDDERRLRAGAACFLAEVGAGRSVTWDVLVPTIEGDPVPTRYNFDGESVTITSDYTYDMFSNGGVFEQRCIGVVPTAWLPEGSECTKRAGTGSAPTACRDIDRAASWSSSLDDRC